MQFHNTLYQFINSTEPINVYLIGVGGTGTEVLRNFVKVHKAMIEIGFHGLNVMAYDPKKFAQHNTGRQLFPNSRLGMNKAVSKINDCNMAFGLNWKAFPKKIQAINTHRPFIITSCVDSVKSRKEIKKIIENKRNYYWIDCGNGDNYGQAIMSCVNENGKKVLKDFFDIYPNATDQNLEPSCSSSESLHRQNLFINQKIAIEATEMLWNLFKKPKTYTHGSILNERTKALMPI